MCLAGTLDIGVIFTIHLIMHRENNMAVSFCSLFLSIILLTSCKSKSHYPSGPLSPEESIKTFHFAENFKVEIYAIEPLVMDPVAMQFDEEGNAYVVEMPDANQPDSARGKGRIIVLKDTDDDGRADTRASETVSSRSFRSV